MRIIELKETVTASNDRDAEVLRGELKKKGTLLINLMASPGAGLDHLSKLIYFHCGSPRDTRVNRAQS